MPGWKCGSCGLLNPPEVDSCRRCSAPISLAAPSEAPSVSPAQEPWPTVPQSDTLAPASAPSIVRMATASTMALLIAGVLLIGLWLAISAVSPSRWEYKTVSVPSSGPSRTGEAAMKYTTIEIDAVPFVDLGKDGWELVDSFLEVETAYPNFGSSEYVTGLQPNVRPQRAVFVFKRPVGWLR